MRILGVPVASPQELLDHVAHDAGSAVRFARDTAGQIERLLRVGEEIARLGGQLIALGERLDARAEALDALGHRLDARAAEIVHFGELLDARAAELLAAGAEINRLGERIDARGGELVGRADQVVHSAEGLIEALPTLERALELATPLEGAIDRVGRFVDRLPGGGAARRGPGKPDLSGM